MLREVESIYLHGVWLTVGTNTPWGLIGEIEIITLEQPDPRNFKGADSAFIRINLSNGYVLEVKTSEYTVYYERGLKNATEHEFSHDF